MINKLIENIKKTNAPIVVGLDPMLNYIPQHIQKKAFSELGETLEGAAEAIWQYNKGIVDAISDLIPAVKPQIAMYEQFGKTFVYADCNTSTKEQCKIQHGYCGCIFYHMILQSPSKSPCIFLTAKGCNCIQNQYRKSGCFHSSCCRTRRTTDQH